MFFMSKFKHNFVIINFLFILSIPYTYAQLNESETNQQNNVATTRETVPPETNDIQSIPKYSIFEVQLTNSQSIANEYTDVIITGVFQGPTQTITINGFWDGGDTWIVRMTPVEVGSWSFTISSSTHTGFDSTGTFECTSSSNKGFIRNNPDYPYSFIRDDGSPVLWKGDTSWRGMTYLVSYENHWKPYIDLRASQGYNVVQSILVSYINGDEFWRNEGGYVFNLTATGKDYDHLNPGYFQWVDKRIEYALSKGISPAFFFTWAQEFVKFSEAQFDRYIKYLVARYAAYNVIWTICGEYDEIYGIIGYRPDKMRHHGNVLADADPYDHPITLHPTGNSTCAEFGNDSWLSFIMQQTYQTTDPTNSKYNINWHSDILQDHTYNKPVINGEYAYAGKVDDDFVRIGAWEIITAGGFFTAGFLETYAPDKGGWDLTARPQQQQELKWLFQFVEGVPYWKMSPHDELTSNGYCLANIGETYLLYSKNGGNVNVNLSDVNAVSVLWFNPREGTYLSEFKRAAAGMESFSPPFSSDWVLYLKTTTIDSQAPDSPENFIILR